MHWIAPSEKHTATDTQETRFWAAVDNLRANSGLISQQYPHTILGLISLRFVGARFTLRRAALEKGTASNRRGSRLDDPTGYHPEGVLYLTPNARFAERLALPEGTNVGAKLTKRWRTRMRTESKISAGRATCCCHVCCRARPM